MAGATPAASALTPGLVRLLADMRAAVTTYVGRRQGEGASVERVLPEVKALVRGAVCGAELREVAQLLVVHAVRWSIEAYNASEDASEDASDDAPHAAPPNPRSGSGDVPALR